METLGLLLTVVGGLVWFVGFVWLIVMMFEKSTVWGIGGIVIPCLPFIFALMNWSKSWKPLLISLAGTGLYMGGKFISGAY